MGVAIGAAASANAVVPHYSLVGTATAATSGVLDMQQSVVNPATHTVYVANHHYGVEYFDGNNPGATTLIPIAGVFRDLVFDPTSGFLYAGGVGGAVYVIDTATNTLIATIQTPLRNAEGLAVDPASQLLYVGGSTADLSPGVAGPSELFVISTATRLVAPVALPAGTDIIAFAGIRINTKTKTVFVPSASANGILVIPESTNQVTTTLQTDYQPTQTVLDQSTGILYEGSYLTGAVNSFDTSTTAYSYKADPIPSSNRNLRFLGVDPSTHLVIVSNFGGYNGVNSTDFVDTTTSPITRTQSFPTTGSTGLSGSISTDPITHRVFVSSSNGTVAVYAPAGIAPSITSPTPPPATVGTPYTAPITVTGDPTIKIAITSGALPVGLVFDPLTGLISGTPTTPGTYSYTITASNFYGTVTQTFSIVVTSPVTLPIVVPTPVHLPTVSG